MKQLLPEKLNMNEDRLQKFRYRALTASLITLIACILFGRFEFGVIAGIPILVSMITVALASDAVGIWLTGVVGVWEMVLGLGFWGSLSDNPISFSLLPTVIHSMGACAMLTIPMYYKVGRNPRQ